MESIGQALSNPDRNIIFDGGDIITQRGYTLVPNFLLNSGTISAGAKLTYVMLLKYAWEKDFCFPGQKTLAEDMGVSERFAHGRIQELVKAGLISVSRRGLGRSNLYTLHLRVHVEKGWGKPSRSSPDPHQVRFQSRTARGSRAAPRAEE